MEQDIRIKPHLTHDDVVALNFIRNPKSFVFRRHYRQGLRSHIMEVIAQADMVKEKHGVIQDGIKKFPRSNPLKMLRIFRTQFSKIEHAMNEIHKVKMIETHLGSLCYARSLEFLTHYFVSNRWEVLLCGLQEYVEGLLLYPWGILKPDYLVDSLQNQGIIKKPISKKHIEDLKKNIKNNAQTFLDRIKGMIEKTGYIPDLAGEGNLILTQKGNIKLVDINNMSIVSYDPNIHIDNKGYPVTDKSIEALCLMETNLSPLSIDMNSRLYGTYMDPKRRLEVKAIEKEFFSTP